MTFRPLRHAARVLPGAALVLALWALPGAPSAAEEAPDRGPTRVIERLHEALLGAMKEAESLGFEGRYEQLAPVLRQSFDLDFMASKAVGRHWRGLSEEEQARIRDVFERFMISTYANRFSGYDGESFQIHAQQEAPRDTMFVRTSIVRSDGDTVEINYRLRETGQGWRIIDVLLRGTVSELALRRSEYSSVIERDGFESLVESLEQKIVDLSEGRVDEAAS